MDFGFQILDFRFEASTCNGTRMTRMVRINTDHFAVRDRMNQSSKGETTRVEAIRSLTAKSVKIRLIRVIRVPL